MSSTLASASSNTAEIASPSSSFSEFTELRSRHCNFTVLPSDTTRARLLDVCTSPGIETDIFCTPFGQPTTARIRFSATSLAIIVSGASVSVSLMETASSIPANSAFTTFSYAFRSLVSCSRSLVRTISVAVASRGIALRRPPPSTEHNSTSIDFFCSRMKRNSNLLALARCSTIWIPECPPLRPLTTSFTAR